MFRDEDFTPNQLAWLEALRNGKYRQGRGLLEVIEVPGDKPEYCCLGVACIVAEQNGVSISRNPFDHNRVDGSVLYGYQKDVAEWLQISREGQHMLTRLNDYVGLSFPQIADFIRYMPEYVFTNFKKREYDGPKCAAT